MTGALAFLQAGFVHYQIQIKRSGNNEANGDSAQAHGQPSLSAHTLPYANTYATHSPDFCILHCWPEKTDEQIEVLILSTYNFRHAFSPIPHNLQEIPHVSGGLCLQSPED